MNQDTIDLIKTLAKSGDADAIERALISLTYAVWTAPETWDGILTGRQMWLNHILQTP